MKLLHTSDWHLGRQFHNVSLLEDQKLILGELIRFIDAEKISGVIIAGDIYDRTVPPAAAVELLDSWITSVITDRSIPVLMISGNHDGAERLGFGSTQLKEAGLAIVSNLDDMLKPITWQVGDQQVQIVGIPYIDPNMVKHHFPDSAEKINDFHDAHRVVIEQLHGVLDTKTPRICVSHCFIDGADECESERPLSIGGADRVGYKLFEDFDYAALGHLHQQQYKGEKHIRYSGSPMKYSFSEQHHNKGVTVIEIIDNAVVDISHHSIKAPKDMRIIEGSFDELLEHGATDDNAHDYLLARITDNHAILDPMAKLRTVYPNILHLERPGLMAAEHPLANQESLKRSEVDIFADFFSQVSGEALSEEQTASIKEVIATAKKEEA